MRNGISNQESHGTLGLLLAYLALVFVGGALISPWIYVPLQQSADHSASFQSFANTPFHRVVHRALLALAIVGLWPFCKLAGIRWRNLGMSVSRLEVKRFTSGLCLGFFSLACVAALALMTGARSFHPSGNLTSLIATALCTALIVAVIEEVIFRGALFGSLQKTYSWPTALLASSAIYALVHFFSRPASPGEVTWLSGFFILKEMLRGFIDLQTLIPGFLNLTLAGAILAVAYRHTGTLSFSIGLHAGWIFWLKSYGAFTTKTAHTNEWLWGTAKLVDGWIASVVLTGVLLFVIQRLHPRALPKT